MKTILLFTHLLLLLVTVLSCSDREEFQKRVEIIQEPCPIDSNVVAAGAITKAEGIIVTFKQASIIDTTTFYLAGGTFIPERKTSLMWPCNLPENYRQDSLHVVFSGILYRYLNDSLVDYLAQPFEFTEITFRAIDRIE